MTEEKALAIGINGFLIKPIKMNDLCQKTPQLLYKKICLLTLPFRTFIISPVRTFVVTKVDFLSYAESVNFYCC